jgi:hypothetical protein
VPPIVSVPETVNVATLSLAGPTQVETVFAHGLADKITPALEL